MNKRRTFIQTSLLATGAGALAAQGPVKWTPGYVDRERPTVGHGDFTYQVDKTWGVQDPRKVPVHHCHEMVLDHKGRILMTTTGKSNHNIIAYDRSGKVLDSWGTEYPGAHGLTIAGEGSDQFLLITDPDTHKVFQTTLKGRLIREWARPKEIGVYEKDEDFNPTETAVAPNGDIYVADGYGKDLIIRYNARGEYLDHFGGKGDGDSEFDCCHGITLDYRNPEDPTLLITSRSKNEFKRFTLDGEHLETIPLPGCSICRPVIHGDYLYFAVIVTESWWNYDGMLAVLDKDNRVVSFPGGSAPVYADGELQRPVYDGSTFLNPHDVLVDEDENLYVPQWLSGKTYPVKLHLI